MRKHSVRKWLHAVLDLLPVLILPVFAIYEINHDHNEPISVDVSQNEVIDFNQQIKNGNFTSVNDWSTLTIGNNRFSVTDNIATINIPASSTTAKGIYSNSFRFSSDNVTHKFYCSGYFNSSYGNVSFGQMYAVSSFSFAVNTDTETYTHVSRLFTISQYNSYYAYFSVYYAPNSTAVGEGAINCHSVWLCDLTQMYGAGNEPSLVDFELAYGDMYYQYTLSKKQLVKDVDTITYADTDVGSQMIYSLYKPVVNYFNFNNVFNFGAIYDWFQLNMFNGNAPMVAFIVWNIIVYEFIMDILFLVYSVFMFLIDFAEGTLEKFTGWCTRG